MTDSRRSWMTAEARATGLCKPAPPSLSQVFRNGFLNGSMLQMAVCSPPREAEMAAARRPYAAIYETRFGTKTATAAIATTET